MNVPLELLQTMDKLIGAHGLAQVQSALKAAAAMRERQELGREQMQRLSDLLDLCRISYTEDVLNIHQLAQKMKRCRIPGGTQIEILERVASYRPTDPWAFLNRIVREDYPWIPWGSPRAATVLEEP